MKSKAFNGIGANHILIDADVAQYARAIHFYIKHLQRTHGMSEKQSIVLDQLLKTCHDFDAHQLCWVSGSHLFGNHLPPLRLPRTVHTADMHPHILDSLEKGFLKMKRVSSFLYAQGLPEKREPKYTEVEDIFNTSQLQALLSE